MNIGIITTPNAKGQVVIPKKFRDKLGISENTTLNIVLGNDSVQIYPISSVVKTIEANKALLKILEQTQGSWAGDDWPKTEKKQRKIELPASKRAKNAW